MDDVPYACGLMHAIAVWACSIAALALVLFAQPTLADDDSWLERAENRFSSTYKEGNTDLYLPFYTYHMRFAYTRQEINSFQENPPGLGIGRGLYDSDGDWHGIYAMGFQDSHFKPMWMAGYAYETFWHPGGEWKVGAGYTAFLATRSNIRNYTPFPGILPTASIRYRHLSIETAYVPGYKGNGNVLFFWGKYEFQEPPDRITHRAISP